MNKIINQKLFPYILLFILALVQCFFLSVTKFVEHKIVYTLSTFIFYLLVGGISKRLLNFFIVLSFIVTCFIYPTQIIYGRVDSSLMSSIYYTDPAESYSYIKIIPYYVYLLLILLALFSFFVIKKNIYIKSSLKIKFLLLILLLLPTIVNFISHGTTMRSYKYVHVLPLRKLAVLDEYRKIKQEDEFIKQEAKKESSWIIEESEKNDPNRNVVVVIGESVRKDFLNSYGFPISNTPFISGSKNIQFNNYISVAFTTIPSLLRTIALPESNLIDYQINNNMISLAKKLGYKTYWISNNSRFGKHNSPTTIIAEQADSCLFISKKISRRDTEMLPHLNRILSKNKRTPTFIVLHMLGSHPSASDRTNGVYDEFLKSKEISCYIKTIRILDDFLKDIHQKLEKEQKPYDLIYFSDHGLKLREHNFIHNGSVKEAFNVPLLLWSDKIMTSKQINSQRRGFDFLYFLSEILNVKTKNIQREYQFISEDKNQDTIINVLDRNNNILNYEKLKDNPVGVLFEQ